MSRVPHTLPFSPDDDDLEVEDAIPNLFHTIPDLAAGATPTAAALVGALIFTSHALKQFVNGCMESAPGMPHLSMPRAHLLLMVAEAGSVRMGDLSRVLGVTPRNVTTLVDAIEKEGLIVRRPDPGDRRAILLELSEGGNALMGQ